MIYLFLYIFFLLLCIFQLVFQFQFTKKINCSLVFLLIFLAGIRVNTGIDYQSYLDIWISIQPITEQSSFTIGKIEPGFTLLISLIKTFTTKSIYFYLTCAFLCLFPVFLGLVKLNIPYMSISFFIYLLVFYLTYPFNGMRQGIAMGFFIFSIPYILNKKKSYVFFLSIIASSIHLTGLLIIVAYFVIFSNIKIKYFFVIGLLGSLFCLNFDLLGKLLFNILGVSMVYVEIFTYSTSAFQIITRTLLLFMLFYFGNKIKNPTFDKIFIMYLTGFFIYVALFQYNLLATRFNMFFRLLEIIMVPMILDKTKNSTSRLAILFIFLVPFTYSFYTFLLVEENKYNFELNF